MAEDIIQIRKTIAGLANTDISLAEFVALVSPYTSDKGENLRLVMTDDLGKFRQMANRVYDTMTADVGDVLANEQLALENRYTQEMNKLKEMTKKNLAVIKEKYPKFNMEQYKTNPNYINELFPKDMAVKERSDELAERHRQEVHHRLQWLRDEGKRLQAENKKLENVLQELEKIVFDEADQQSNSEEEAVRTERQLQIDKTYLQNKLDEIESALNELDLHESKSWNMSPEQAFEESPKWTRESVLQSPSLLGKNYSPINMPAMDSEDFDKFVDQYLEANKPSTSSAGKNVNVEVDETEDFDALLDAFLTENDLWSQDFRKPSTRRKK